MTIGISDLAHSVRKNSSSTAAPVKLGRAHQLVVAALGYKTLAAYQAAQDVGLEPLHLGDIRHIVLDHAMVNKRAGELGIALALSQLHELIGAALQERAPQVHAHSSFNAFEEHMREHVVKVFFEDNRVNTQMANTNCDGVDEIYFDFEPGVEAIDVSTSLDTELKGYVRLGIDPERPYSGHILDVEATLGLERMGRQCFGPLDCQVKSAGVNSGWEDEYQDGEPPVVRTLSISETAMMASRVKTSGFLPPNQRRANLRLASSVVSRSSTGHTA